MKALSKRIFTRLSGAGNSFIICNTFPQLSEVLDIKKRKNIARQVCLDTDGIMANGFICLEPSQKTNFKWDFYNSDGSHAEMCGNAARCAVFYYYHKINHEKKIKFETEAGVIEAEILSLDDQIVQVVMPKLAGLERNKEVVINGKTITGFFINTGVPHFVIQRHPDFDLAKKIRKASEFKQSGTNVTFVNADEADSLSAVTFERGVEDFTLSCGTGAVAAACFQKDQYPKHQEFLVEMPGGILSIDLKNEQPVLIGNVEIQFDFSLYEEVI